MRLMAFTDFGLRALMRLAADPGRALTTEALATELAISRNHLVKVVQALAEAGLVRTLRGARGGVALAKPPADIRLGAVVRRLERGQALVECFREDPGRATACTLLPCCRLRGALADAREAFFASLDRTTLAECAVPAPALRPPRDAPAGRTAAAV